MSFSGNRSKAVTGSCSWTMVMGTNNHELGSVCAAIRVKKREKVGSAKFYYGDVDGSKICLVLSGMGAKKARDAASLALGKMTPRRVLILGVSGGLSPNLSFGDIFFVTQATRPSIGTDPQSAIAATEMSITQSVVAESAPKGIALTSEKIVANPDDKKALHQQYNALGVDLETYHYAQVCHQHGVPWGAFRAISDSQEDALPQSLVDLVEADGKKVQFARALSSLALNQGVRSIYELRKQVNHCSRALGELFREVLKTF